MSNVINLQLYDMTIRVGNKKFTVLQVMSRAKMLKTQKQMNKIFKQGIHRDGMFINFTPHKMKGRK